MGKSVTSTIMGTLIHKGVYTLDQPAPIPEWQAQPTTRAAQIKIQDILRMSSGIRIISPCGSRLRPEGPLSRSPLPLHRRRQRVQLRGDAAAAVAAQHGRPLPQHRSGADQLPEPAGHREAEARLPVVPAAPPVGQDRRAHDGDGDRSVGQLPDPGLRVHVGPRLGAPRQPVSQRRRRARRRAHPAGELQRLREHAGARRGSPTSGRSTAASSGSTATASGRFRRRRTR